MLKNGYNNIVAVFKNVKIAKVQKDTFTGVNPIPPLSLREISRRETPLLPLLRGGGGP